MADGKENSDESCDADEACSSSHTLLVCEDAESRFVTSMDEACFQYETKSSSARPSSGGAYQGPHDWRKRLRPISCLDHIGNNGTTTSGDRKVKSPDDARQRNGTDITSVSFDRLHSFYNNGSLLVITATNNSKIKD